MNKKKQNTKWFLCLGVCDYGGGCDDGIVYSNLDELAKKGLKYLKKEISTWKRISKMATNPEDFDSVGFDDLTTNVEDVLKELVVKAKKHAIEHEYSFGSVDGNDDTYLMIRPATESDIRCFYKQIRLLVFQTLKSLHFK